jgi:hypothetical protein
MKSVFFLAAATVVFLLGGETQAEDRYSYDISMNSRYAYSFAFQDDKVLTKGWGDPDSACKKEGMVVPFNTAQVPHPRGQFSMLTTHTAVGGLHKFKMEEINIDPRRTFSINEFTFQPGADCKILSWQYTRFQFPSGELSGSWDMTHSIACERLPFEAFAKPKWNSDGSRC